MRVIGNEASISVMSIVLETIYCCVLRYEEWREMRLVELTQMPNYYDKVYYDESLVGKSIYHF